MNAPVSIPTPPYHHTPLFPLGKDKTQYRKIAGAEAVKVEKVMGKDMLVVAPEALRALSEAAFVDINHLLRGTHLASSCAKSSTTRRRAITTSSSPMIF